MSDNAFGSHRPNTLDKPAAQVLFQPGEGGWFGLLSMGTVVLMAIFGMLTPKACQEQCLASMNFGKRPMTVTSSRSPGTLKRSTVYPFSSL